MFDSSRSRGEPVELPLRGRVRARVSVGVRVTLAVFSALTLALPLTR